MTNPTAPANPDATVMHGDPTKPAVDAGAAAAAPELVEVEIGTAKVKVDKSTADAIAAMRAAHDADIAALRAAANRPEPAKPAPAAADPFANIETDLFADPKGTLLRFGEHVAKVVKEDLTKQYEASENRKVFWSEFYKENKDLSGEELIVNAVFNRDFNSLMAMKGAEAMKHLSAKAKSEILRLKGDQGGKGGKLVAEGGNEPGNLSKSRQSKPSDAPDKALPMSLSQALRERRAARRGTNTQKAA